MPSVRDCLDRFYFYFRLVFFAFKDFFNGTIISLSVVGYGMIITNLYPTRVRGIIVNHRVEVQY